VASASAPSAARYWQPSVTYNQAAAHPADFNPIEGATVAPAGQAQKAAAVPLAFTTPADGATPAQAATLGRLQSEFATAVNSQGQSSTDPAYAQTWQAAQELSDSNYEQQFGTEAFIQAQLAQAHGRAN
jgi:hypothetical protein